MLYCTFVKQIGGGSCKWEMKMNDVCHLLEENQLKNCRSITRSGNFIFESDKNKNELDQIIKKLLEDYYQQKISVFTQSQQETIDIQQTFIKLISSIEKGFICNIFLTNKENYGKIIVEQFEDLATKDEKIILKNNICYWVHPKSYITTSLFHKKISKKAFKDNYTLRTIGTIEKVIKKF